MSQYRPIRGLTRNPRASAFAVLVIALGVGLSAAVLSCAYALAGAPLPFPDSGRLMEISELEPLSSTHHPVTSADFLAALRGLTGISLAAYTGSADCSLQGPGGPALQAQIVHTSPQFFSVLGVKPELGVPYSEAAKAPSLVISDALWRGPLRSTPSIIGSTLTINGAPLRVAAVMPGGFTFPDPGVQVWQELSESELAPGADNGHWLSMLGRRRVPQAAATAEVSAFFARLAHHRHDLRGAIATPLQRLDAGSRQRVTELAVIVLLLLLMLVVSVAMLFSSMTNASRADVALRLCLGAPRRRVALELLADAGVLIAIGAGFGIALGLAGERWLAAAGGRAVTGYLAQANSAWHVAFAATVAAVAALLAACAAAIAVAATKGTGFDELQRARPGATHAASAASSWMIAAEALLVTILLVAAMVIGTSLKVREQIPLGFDPQNLVTFSLNISGTPGLTIDQLIKRAISKLVPLVGRVGAIPGVTSVSATFSAPPLDDFGNNTYAFTGNGAQIVIGGTGLVISRAIARNYFRTMRIPLLAGSDFTQAEVSYVDANVATAVRPVIINSIIADRYFGSPAAAIGRAIRLGSRTQPPAPIVGVAAPSLEYDLANRPSAEVYYLGTPADHGGAITFLIRSRLEPALLFATAQRLVDQDVPGFALGDAASYDDILGQRFAFQRGTASLLAQLSVLAWLVALAGIYALAAQTLAASRRDFAIRVAMGATWQRLALRSGSKILLPVASGLAAGLLAWWPLQWIIRGLLYGVAGSEAWPLIECALAVLITASVAIAIPLFSDRGGDLARQLRPQ